MIGKEILKYLRDQGLDISLYPFVIPQSKLTPKLRGRLNANITLVIQALCEEWLASQKERPKESEESS